MTFATEDNITAMAVERWSTARDPRTRQLLTAAVKHLHAFVREVELTEPEWLLATEFLTGVGKISDAKRKEFILLSDVLGVSMLTVMINGRTPSGATPNTVLGPFHIDDSPILDMGAALPGDLPGERLYISGTVRDLDGAPIAGVLLDIWQADEDGTYETQIPDSEARLRGLQYTDAEGRYGFWTIAPKGYSIPMDGPVGTLVRQTAISHFRPAHVHFLVSAKGYQPIVTHLFREGAEFIDTDVVFGTKRELVVPFVEVPAGACYNGSVVTTPHLRVDYDFVLVKASAPSTSSHETSSSD